jgi:serine kinase
MFISSKKIAHRDIKMENLLLTRDYILKISDFGFASFSKDLLDQVRGTLSYLAPEILLLGKYKGE